MSSQARQDLEADTAGSHSSSRGIIPSHPVEFDSDMEEASRSVSPEPHNHKAASQGPSSRLQSNLGSSTYPPGYSADGIPPEISPALLKDKVTSTERVAIVEHQPLATESVDSDVQQDSAIQHPTSLTAVVPSRTDHGIADASVEGNSNSQAETQPQPSPPSSPSKSPSFFSRILGGFMPGSTPAASETSEQGRYLSHAPSASWGTSTQSQPLEEVRHAGTVRANETGLDEPTATKQAGLEGGSGYEQSLPNTAVAAAESLADTKAGAQYDTEAAGQYAPQSPGRSESEYYGTPQASPDKGPSSYAGDTTQSNQSGQKESYDSEPASQGQGTGVVAKLKSAVGAGSTEPGSQTSSQGYSQGGNQGYSQGGNQGYSSGRPAWATGATPSAPASESVPATEHKYGQPYGESEMAASLSAAQGSREYDNTDSFKTAPSTQDYREQERDTMGSTGVLGTVLNAVGLSGKDDTITSSATHTERDSSPTRSPGVFGALKDAVGLGDNSSTSNTTGSNTFGRPAWATAGVSEAPGSQSAPGQNYQYGQPYGQSDMAKSLSSAQPSTGYSGSSQQPSQGTSVLDQVKSAVGLGSGTDTQTQGIGQGRSQGGNQGYTQATSERFMSSRPAWATAGASQAPVSQQAPVQDYKYSEPDTSRSLSSAQPGTEYTGQSQSQGQGTGVVDKLKSAVGAGSSSTGTGTHAAEQGYSQAPTAVGQQAPINEYKYGQPYGDSDMARSLSSAPAQTNTDYTGNSQSQGQGTGVVDKLKSAVGASSGSTRGTGTQASEQGYSQAPTSAAAVREQAPAQKEYSYGQPYGESDMYQKLSAPQQTRQDTASGDQYRSSRLGSTDDSQAQGQATGVVDKLKSVVGLSSSDNNSTEPAVARSGFSASSNPIYESDTPRSGAGIQTTRTLQAAPPSASWGTAKTSYTPTTAVSQADYSGSATTGAAATDYSGSAATGAAGDGKNTYSGKLGGSSSYQGGTPAQDSSLSKGSAVKGSSAGGQGQVSQQPTQALSTESPKATEGIRGKTPVQESAKAFTEEVPSGPSAGQGVSGTSSGQGPAKIGTTAFEHASTRSPGSPMARSGAAAGGTSTTTPSAGQPASPAGQPEQPVVLGTTVFQHALARTSGKPLSRASGTPSSPPTSFKGRSGVEDGASGGVQGAGRTTSELPVSTSAPPGSTRTTQESPAEAAATTRPSQAAIKEEPTAEGKGALPEGKAPVTEGKALDGNAGSAAATPAAAGTAAPAAAEKRATAAAAQPSSAAAQSTSTHKKPAGIAGCFACFGGQSAKE